MPYDLYGNYYKSERDAMNAELAQMSDIDNRITNERLRKLEKQEQYPNQELWQYIYMLQERIKALEENQTKS
jgi:hypothetical protein